MASERFRFREDVLGAVAASVAANRRRVRRATAAIVAGVWALALRPRGSPSRTLAFSLGLLLGLAALSLGRRMQRLHARWSTFEIALDEDAIARTVSGYPPLRIARADVETVGERADGIVVRGRGGAALLVPRDLDGYAQLRETLAGWTASPRGG